MTRRRVSGRELARKLGVSPSWVSYRLTGAQPIDLDDLQLIAEALGAEPAALIPRSGVTYPATDTSPYSVVHVDKDVVRVDRARPDRPSGRRDHSRPGGRSAPSGPGRTSRVAA